MATHRAEIYYSCDQKHFGQPCDGDHRQIVGRFSEQKVARAAAKEAAANEAAKDGRDWGWSVICE